ncbi:MAG: TerB family tellurite resistance protein, partial [Paludibacteraceae bacterium]|nr:TerB family tellurite resistance protein [Paludibacteraceae bacterium]
MNKKSFYAGAIGFLIGGPLGAIIGFVLGSIIFSNNKEKENNSGDGNEGGENNFKYCILVLLGEVMKADGRLMSCELDRVKATIRRYYKTESEQKSALKQFQTILDHHHNLEAICSSINKRLNYIAKSELIMELLAVAYADDHFDTTEETIIQKIVKNLN